MVNLDNLFASTGYNKIYFDGQLVDKVYFDGNLVYKYCNNITLSTFSATITGERAYTPSNVVLCNTRPKDESSIITDNAGEDYKITSSVTTTRIRYDEPVQLKGASGAVPSLLNVHVNDETYDFPYHYTATHNGLTLLSTFSLPVSLGTCSDNTSIKAVSPLSTLQRIVTNSCLLKTVSMSYSSFSLATP